MAENKKRKTKSYSVKRTALAVIMLCFAAICVFRYVYQEKTMHLQKTQIGELEAQISAAKEEKEHYENLNKLYQDPDYIKMLAKEKLGLLEENEVVYKISE